MREVVLCAPVRTAIGSFGGALADLSAVELGARVVSAAIERCGLSSADVDEVILGQVLQAGAGSNPARQVSLAAGLPVSVPAFTVNKVCASGMKAITLGALAVASGEAEVVVAGGMENMSGAPYLLPKARWGQRLGDGELQDVILQDALSDPMEGFHMGVTAEHLAQRFGISREEQDQFAADSQRKTEQAVADGAFRDEIVPVEIPQRKGEALRFEQDEYPRNGITVEGLAALRPAFSTEGTVTAGNASGINDGAAAMVLMTAEAAAERGVPVMGRILGYASAGVEPMQMGLGPVPATRRALALCGLSLNDIEAVELNEAFAAQSLAVLKELDLEADRVNLKGGAIALGHPVGASGARIVVTLLHLMAQQNLRRGLATLCVGGGQGMAMVLGAP